MGAASSVTGTSLSLRFNFALVVWSRSWSGVEATLGCTGGVMLVVKLEPGVEAVHNSVRTGYILTTGSADHATPPQFSTMY